MPANKLSLFFVGLGLLTSISYLFLNDNFFLNILQTGANLNSVVDQSDLQFIQQMRWGLLAVGALLVIAGILITIAPPIAQRLTPIRIYVGLLLIALFFLVGTPFALPSAKLFLYDFGYNLKGNALSSEHSYGGVYYYWFRDYESLTLLFSAGIGLIFAFKQKWRGAFVLLLYLLLLGLAIATATRGYVRYLTPLLPALYIFVSAGILAITKLLDNINTPLPLGAIFIIAILWVIGVDYAHSWRYNVLHTDQHNSEYFAYQEIETISPERLYVAGFVPAIELQLAGHDVHPLSNQQIASGEFLSLLGSDQYLLIDDDAQNQISPSTHSKLELVWQSDPSNKPQFIYRIIP